ncbi:MAG: DUF6249 domain-containing protein [Verrucomicrobiota bacterium]|nr:DUF6249 domain-containing protein [Verrucomicrobiota bacterium]
MKSTFLICACAFAFAATAPGQIPSPTPDSEALAAPASPSVAPDYTPATPAPTTAPVVAASVAPASTVAPALAPAASPDTEEEFDRAIERKIKRHLKISVNGDKSHDSSEDNQWWIPLVVLFSCLALFGTPVAVVATIMYFSFSKNRAMHRTVRMMVEKGQPVPESLLNPPPVVRQRSDLRRGIVLLMVGSGLVIFLGAVNDWDGGAWSIGIIPFMIGLGYLLVWKLDVHREESSPKV